MTQKFMRRVGYEGIVITRNYVYEFRCCDATIWRRRWHEDDSAAEKVGYYDDDKLCFVNLENTR